MAIVHVGTHKTGTTSFQRWAEKHRDTIQAATGLRYYLGMFGSSHFEMALLAMRPERNMPMRAAKPDWCLESFQAEVRAHIATQAGDDLLISAEALSYLRHPDEVARLEELIGPSTYLVALRNRADFLRSYRAQMEKMGFPPSRHPESFAYTEDDTWLADFDGLVATFPGVRVVDYDSVVAEQGSVIPALMTAAGVSLDDLPDWSDEWAMRSDHKRRGRQEPRRPLP